MPFTLATFIHYAGEKFTCMGVLRIIEHDLSGAEAGAAFLL
jgi:hypothetical protein